MGFLRAVVSPRPGELRWRDIRVVVDRDADAIEVIVVRMHEAPVSATIRLTRRWAGGGWASALECPGCRSAANVLRLAHGELFCARCRRELTERDRRKNTKAWNELGGRHEDEFLRAILRHGGRGAGDCTALGTEMVDRDAAQAEAVVENGEGLVQVLDGRTVAEPGG